MFKKYFGVILALTIALCMAGCEDVEPTEPDVTEGTVTTAPSGDSGGVEPGVTEPDPTVPATPTGPVDPSAPADPSEPTGPVDPVDPTDPTEPSEPDVPEHQHSYAEEVTKATCTEDGFTTYTCECGDTYTGSKVAATGHTWSEWTTIEEPTQTATGLAGRNCTVCGEKETKELAVVIPDHTHSYTGEITKAATCTAEGVKTFTCSCGSSYTESIAKISHIYKETVTKPTCTTNGYTTYKCGSCGDTYMEIYVTATGHKFGTYTSNGDATCTQDGTKTAKCTVCSATKTVTDTGSAKGHSFISYKPNGDATCTKDGTKSATCSNGCGTKDTVTDSGSAKGHSYTKTVTAPTCTTQGFTTYKCGACGDSYKDSYTDKVDHSYSVVSTKEPTLWAQGSIKYKCGTCSSTYTEYTDPLTGEAQQAYLREIAAATLKYINQFREEQGDTVAISLPGLTLVAEYRAVQLQESFEHSFAASREAFGYYQYGEYHDMTQYGYDESQNYWSANAKEAIQQSLLTGSIDEIGYEIALCFRNSTNHWSYVGSSKYAYIGIGITFDASEYYPFKICVLQTSTNYG